MIRVEDFVDHGYLSYLMYHCCYLSHYIIVISHDIFHSYSTIIMITLVL